jgi:type II secretory ATPase GspE/PulE/Tfp pilus assembly ATPase PilB-like protein
MPSLRVYWNRAAEGGWAEFFALDLDDPHFNGVEGVFVIWQGGSAPVAIATGFGNIRDLLKARRADPAVATYKGKHVFVSWAKVETASMPGVARFLIETLKPAISAAVPTVPAIDINLLWRGEEAPSDISLPPPKQIRENTLTLESNSSEVRAKPVTQQTSLPVQPLAQAPKTNPPALRTNPVKLALQPTFQELVTKAKEMPKTGFFGGNSKPATTNEDKLVGDTVQLILQEAVHMRASDIHLEPQDALLRVRFRIDGILEEVLQIPYLLNLRVVSNVRVMCGLDPEKGSGGKPEDGRVSVKLETIDADLRLSTFPTPHGDKAVIRVIPRNTKTATLNELGLHTQPIDQLRALLHHPQGLIIVTGPTGSGKSTTLYAALHELNDTSRNIVTLEDPIERKLPGITQGTLLPKQGFGFADGLRAILRQDPNIIMVGEIRDTETAEIALSASLTGHLLLTTLHTISALGAVNRLIDMGLEPFLIASALTAVTAQRLARTICTDCSKPYEPTPLELADIEARAKNAGISLPSDLSQHLKKGTGCPQCRGTGYRGRVLIYEAAVVTAPLREAILRKSGTDDLRLAALKGGMEPMIIDGLRKVYDGRTTLTEILRVIDTSE